MALQKDLQSSANSDQKVTIHAVDLARETAVRNAFKKIKAQHDSIRALINNAGTWTGGKTIEQLSKSDILESLEQNFFSAFSATQEVLAIHRSRKPKSNLSIVFIGATSSLQGWAKVGAFCIGKGAMRTLAQSLAREVGPDGIHVSEKGPVGITDPLLHLCLLMHTNLTSGNRTCFRE